MAQQARVDILLALRSTLEGSEKVFGQLGRLKTALFAVASSAPVLAVKAAGDMAGEIKSIAGQSGISTTALQVLAGQMRSNGVEVADLNQALVTLRKNLEEAHSDPKSSLNERLRQLHLTADGLRALRPEEQFEVLGRRIAAATDKEQAFGAALDVLGQKNAPKLLEELKRLGVEGYQHWEKLQRSLTLTPEQLETLDRAGNYLSRIGLELKAAGAKGLVLAIEGTKATVSSVNQRAEAYSGMGGITGVAQFRAAVATAEALSAAAKNEAARNASPWPFAPTSGANSPWPFATAPVAEDPAAGATREQEARMKAAELAATLKVNEEKLKLQAKARNSWLEIMQGMGSSSHEGLEQAADDAARAAIKYRELGDSTLIYKKQLQEIALLQDNGKPTPGRLSPAEAAAATARINAEMNNTVGKAIQKSNDALQGFGNDRARLDNNFFLTNREKNRERLRLLSAENAEISRQIELLRQLAQQPGIDKAAIEGQVRGLGDRQTANELETGGSRDLNGPGENIHGQMTQLQDEFGTVGENIGDTFGNSIRSGMGAAQEQLQLLIGGTDYWSQRLGVIAGPMMGALTAGIAKMFAEWVAGRALAAAKEILFSTKETAAKAPGAILTSISSYGAAAAIGVAAVLAAMASAGKFADGGVIRGPGGPRGDKIPAWLSDGEGILTARTTARLGGESAINALNFSADPIAAFAASPVARGGGGGGGEGGGAFADKPIRVVYIDERDRDTYNRVVSDPRFDNKIVRIGYDRRGELGVDI